MLSNTPRLQHFKERRFASYLFRKLIAKGFPASSVPVDKI